MGMSRDEVYSKVQGVLVDALGVDEGEVKPESTLSGDLGAESIDYLDIVFRIEKAFNIKIGKGELFPDPQQLQTLLKDPTYVQNDKVTPQGLVELKNRMPHVDLSKVEADPNINKMSNLFTVDAIVNYVVTKVG
jgi:acyl carrier protein